MGDVVASIEGAAAVADTRFTLTLADIRLSIAAPLLHIYI